VPAFGSVRYRIDVPTNATGIVLNAGNSTNLVLSLEQGSVALPGGPAHWVSLGTNSSLNQPFTGTWPWLPGYSYYLTVTNTSATPGTFSLTAPDLRPFQLASDPTAASASAMNVWFTITNSGNGAAVGYSGYWYDRITLSTNKTLAGGIFYWDLYRGNSLMAGAAYTQTNSITLPTLTSGTYYLILNADVYGHVPESNDANNTSVPVSFMVGVPPNYRQITGVLLTGGKIRMSFAGLPGLSYALDRTFNLSPPINWVPQVTNPADPSGAVSFTNAPVATTNNFWRIRSAP